LGSRVGESQSEAVRGGEDIRPYLKNKLKQKVLEVWLKWRKGKGIQ
jgi:hypothetical protein